MAPQPLPMQPVTVYSSPAIPTYSMPPPSTAYQHPFVTNVSTSMHPVMPTHYVQQHYPIQEPTEISGRGHRGRGRSRGGKRPDMRMENNMVETSTPQFPSHFSVPVYYHPGFYTQMGSPIQHANPAHTPASPVYVSVYPNMYGTYPPGPQYYPPPTHVNAVIEDTQELPELMAPDDPIYHPINDYPPPIIPVNIPPDGSDVIKSNNNFINANNNMNVKVPQKPKNDHANDKNTDSASDKQDAEEKPVTPQSKPTCVVRPVNNVTTPEPVTKACSPSIEPSPAEVPEIVSATSPPQPTGKSWASLFSSNKSSTAVNISDTSKSPKIEASSIEKADEERVEKREMNQAEQRPVLRKSIYTNDPVSHRMGGAYHIYLCVVYSCENRCFFPF